MLAQFAQAFSRASPFRRGGESMEQARSLVACDQWTTHAHSLGSGACADGARPAPRSLPVRGHRSAMSQVLTRIRDARSNVAWVIVTPGGAPSRRGVRNWPTGTTTPSERRKAGGCCSRLGSSPGRRSLAYYSPSRSRPRRVPTCSTWPRKDSTRPLSYWGSQGSRASAPGSIDWRATSRESSLGTLPAEKKDV